jgi:hypothetical protein
VSCVLEFPTSLHAFAGKFRSHRERRRHIQAHGGLATGAADHLDGSGPGEKRVLEHFSHDPVATVGASGLSEGRTCY